MDVENAVLLPDLVGQQLGQLVEHDPGEANRPGDVPRLDALGERVDRVERADLEDVLAELAVVALGGVAHPEDRELRVDQLPLVAEPVGAPEEDPAVADRDPAGVPAGRALTLGEERHPQAGAAGAEHGLHPVGRPARAAVAVGVRAALADLADDAQHLPDPEVGDVGQRAGLEVAPREVAQEVADGAQPGDR
ncbi:hypothetical protein [Nocardioides sp. TF02-7]|uniref:hypothetical protein n=1 Tax=Nocardioides sp. TF02-7 TaxID=2917724 RepID=UPI001F06F805|nr:hypothetical protein [Nocardioides sp. TF02-7]UMG93069.1 hypothetical protein MF408_01635 [Nocardioides sp. TF02-7]